ncbi:MAG TPA: DUF4129 domain-containing protein [Edaphobacter sp.]|nr:DUF4129 domain-containing protein [Edaphobacter sp.]
MRLELRVILGGILLISASALGQVQGDRSEETANVRVVTAAEYRGHLESLKMLAKACEKNPAECDAKKVGDDERVEGAGFQTRWSWLREVISSARNATQSDSETQLQEAVARLDEDIVLAGEAAPQTADAFSRARKQADDVLSRPEFRTVTEASYWQREMARFWQWVAEMFGGVSRFGKRSPWLVPLMEWSFITLACAGLLTWVFRTMQRQRLAVRIESSATSEIWQKESDDWAELARAEAARKDWRAAVHCIYWATIVMMEGKKLWRQNRARTPREYLMLLEPGSGMQQTLRRLTQLFERIWYGLRPAAESDYASALVLFEELRGA